MRTNREDRLRTALREMSACGTETIRRRLTETQFQERRQRAYVAAIANARTREESGMVFGAWQAVRQTVYDLTEYRMRTAGDGTDGVTSWDYLPESTKAKVRAGDSSAMECAFYWPTGEPFSGWMVAQ